MRDYPKKFSAGLAKRKNYAAGGEVTGGGWLNEFLHKERPALQQLKDTLNEPNDLYDRATEGSIYSPESRNQTKPDGADAPENPDNDPDEEYRKGGPVKKRKRS